MINDIKNGDYLMIKGSNSTGLNKISQSLKVGKINAFSLFSNLVEIFSFLNVFKYLTVKLVCQCLSSMIVVFLVGGPLINYFSSHQIHDPIREDGPSDHIVKKIGTPTMGGLMILLGIFSGVILWGDFRTLIFGFYFI